MTEKELEHKIARAMNLSRSNGWYFEKHGEQLNATDKVSAVMELMRQYTGSDMAKQDPGNSTEAVRSVPAAPQEGDGLDSRWLDEWYKSLPELGPFSHQGSWHVKKHELLALITTKMTEARIDELTRAIGGHKVAGLQWAGADPRYKAIKARIAALKEKTDV